MKGKSEEKFYPGRRGAHGRISGKFRPFRRMGWIIQALSVAVLLAVLPTAALADTATYDYTTDAPCVPGTDCWLYADDVDVFPFAGVQANQNTHVLALAADYTNVSTSNDTRFVTADPGATDETFLWAEMQIAETVSQVYRIDFTFEGYLALISDFAIHVLTAGAAWEIDASWTQIGAVQNIPAGTETTFTRSAALPTNLSAYFDGTKKITWGVSEVVSSEAMNIDYIRMIIYYDPTAPTFTVTDGANPAWNTSDTITVTVSDTGGSGAGATTYWGYSADATCDGADAYPNTGLTTTVITTHTDYVCFRNTDGVGNIGYSAAIGPLKVDIDNPTVTINNPAAASWQRADFVVDVTNADTGGSGLNVCRYRVLSNAVETLGWTPYACATDPTITVLAGTGNCRDQGANMCSVEFYDTDVAGNTGATVSRLFKIDWTSPVQSGWNPANGATVNSAPTVTLTLDEQGDCRWSLDGDESYAQMADDGDCTGDGTASSSCAVTGLPEGAVTLWISCRDTIGNENSAANNAALSYTADIHPPAQIPPWTPDKGSVLCSTSQAIAATTDENAWCRCGLSDIDYDSMASDCSGSGTTSQTCPASGFAHGAEYVYIACKDTLNNKDSAATNEDINYTVDIIAPTGYACSTPANSSIDVSFTPTLTSAAASDVTTISYYFQIAKNTVFTTALQESGWQSADTTWVPLTLDSNTAYYWHVKAKDVCGYEGTYSAVFSFTTLQLTPNITFVSSTQAPDGSGELTATYNLTDYHNDPARFLIEYSFDGAAWSQAYIKSPASAGTVDNTGVSGGTSTGQITAIPTPQANATFIWLTQNASNEGGAFAGEDDTVYIRVTTYDAAQGETQTSSAFGVDNKAPSNYGCSTPPNGTTGVSINPTLTAAAGTDQNAIQYFIEIAKDSGFTIALNQSGWQAGLTWNPPTLDQGVTYYWHVKARDPYGNEGAYSLPTWDFLTATNEPDVNIDSASQTSTAGEGYVRVQYDLTDPNAGDTCAILIEYSYDNANWYKAWILDAGIGTVDNGAARQISALTCGAGVSNAWFRWAAKNAGNGGGAFNGEDDTVYVRITPNDGTQNGQIRHSAFFTVDNQAPAGYGLQYPANGETGVDTTVSLTAAAASDISTVYYTFRADRVPADWAAPDFQEGPWVGINTWTVGTALGYVTNYEYSVKAKDQYGNAGTYVSTWQFTTKAAPDVSAWPFAVYTDYMYDSLRISVASNMAQLRANADPGWFDTRWTYRKKITINNTGSSNTLYDYQLAVTLNAGNFDFTKARSDGGDLRFYDNTAQGTPLEYWIESYNSVAQTAKIWVKVVEIPASSEYFIFMYYGYSSATTTQNIANTFDAAQWTDGKPAWVKIDTKTNVTASDDVIIGEELVLDGMIQSLGGNIRRSRIRLVNNSTLYVNAGQILRLYANEIFIEAGSRIDGVGRGYAGGAGGVMCAANAAAPWNGGQQIAANGVSDAAGPSSFGGGGTSHENDLNGRDGRGGGGGGYGGMGGAGENGWPGTNPDPPSCMGNYSYSGGLCNAGAFGLTFGNNSDETIYMGSGGGAGSASCYTDTVLAFSAVALGGSGGYGGGAALLDGSTVNIAGDIYMDGGIAGSGLYDAYELAGGAGGGGGGGGTIMFRGQNLTLSGNISVKGGMGGGYTLYGAAGGGGGGGRIKIFENTLTDASTKYNTGGAVGGNNAYTPNGVAGSAGTTWINAGYGYTYNSGIADNGNFKTYAVSPFFLGKKFTSAHTMPVGGVGTLTYEIRRASDDALLCTITAAQAAAGYDILSCTQQDTPIKIYASLSTTNFPGSPIIADITLDYYTRKIVETPPTVSVGAQQTFAYFTDNPTIQPIVSRGIVFAELVSFTETLILPDTTGQVRYQISNDGTSWYWWNGSNWAASAGYGQTNAAAEINANCATFDNEIGGGTLYFRAYLHSDGTQKVLLDSVDVQYVTPPTPDITLLTPANGVAGTTVTITGTDFGTSQGSSRITFNGVDAGSATSWSNTSIVINAPLNVTTGYVVATVRSVQSPQEADSIFTVNAPTISSLTPNTAYWTDAIVIAGNNFGASQGGSYVKFYNNVTATCTSWTNTSITCTVPPGAATGNVTVTTGGGTSGGTAFTLSSDNSTWPFGQAGSDLYTWDADANVTGGLAYLKSNNSPAWAPTLTNYNYRRKITINNTGGGALTNFQVKIDLNNTNFSFGSVQSDGKDIRFTDSDGVTAIGNFWIQSYNSTSLTAVIWVKVPAIPASSNKDIYMYYGYSNETTALSSRNNALDNPTTWTNGNPTWDPAKVSSSVSMRYSGLADATLDYQTNLLQRTCTDTWSAPCDAQNDIENSTGCVPSHGTSTTYEKVLEVTLDKTKVEMGGTITATCRFQADNGSEEYIYYNNGTGWVQKYSGVSGAFQIHNVVQSWVVTGNAGTQWVRCIVDWDGENDSCASAGSYYDNDDASFFVHYKTAGELTGNSITNFMGGIQFTAAQTKPAGTGISYKILRASDNITLCTVGTLPYDISTCASAVEPVKAWTSLTTTDLSQTPAIADWTVTYYSRQTASPEPAASVSLAQETPTYYTSDPAVRPAAGNGRVFVEMLSFSEILGPRNAGSVKYQISNNGTNWYWWSGANWAAAGGGYATANTAAEINNNVQRFHLDAGAGTFYFRAYLHTNGSQAVEIDGVTINVAQITITEVNNDGIKTGEGDDYIQLYNPFSTAYDLTGHIIGDDKTKPGGGENEFSIAAGETIPAKGYYLIAKSAAEFIARFACEPSKVHEWGATLDLASAGDEVYIKTAATPTVSLDLVVWGAYTAADLPEGTFNGTAAPLSGDGKSIKRITDGYEDGEKDGGDADASPENDEPLGSTLMMASPPTPWCVPPTTGTLTISDNGGYTNDSTPPITLTCEDPAGVDCNSSDFMKIACTEAGLSSATWASFEKKCNETGYSCAFNITSGTACTGGEGAKTVWVEYKNERGNIQTVHASDTTIYDITAPTITAVLTYSDNDQYLCGTNGACVTLSPTTGGTTYFNNLGGEGNTQKMTVELAWTDNNGDVARDQYIGPFAFSESPTYDGTNVGPDTNGADSWKQIYTINSGEGNENGIIFRVYDKAGNSKSVTLTFTQDNTDPTVTYTWPAAGGVTNWYKTDPGSVINIDFGWVANSPLAYAQYKIGVGAWPGPDIFNAFQSSDYTANWNIPWASIPEGMNQISVRIVDGCGNSTTHTYVENTTGFIFRKDTTPPTITAITLTSGNELYFYGTGDGLDCSAVGGYPAVTCAAWFNSNAGEGGAQTMTAAVAWTDAASYDRLQGPIMFGDNPTPDTTPAPWSLDYSIDNGSTDQLGKDFNVYDQAGNVTAVKIDFKVDNTKPTTTIVSPAASAWKTADFVVDVTNADVGSGLVACYYRVLSNAVETKAWTSYTCTSDPTLTVGAAANCRDQGADLCQVQFYNTDRVGNVGVTVTRQFSIDWTPPTIAINSPAASAWKGADFVVDVTNADPGAGSGLNVCYYRVLSNAVVTLAWTSYACATDPTITVLAVTGNCRDEGADKCEVQFYDTDVAGNTGTTVTRLFSIDWTAPTVTINSPAASAWKGADFVVDVTNADPGAGSGLNVCYYRVLSNAVVTLAWTSYACATDPTITVLAVTGNCRDEGADKCEVQFYDTDVAGNTGTTVTRLFSIDWTAPTVTINSPAASSWKGADFVVDVTNTDPGTGSGLNVCYYRVLSNAVETLGWTSYVCATDPTITVLAVTGDCRDEGADKCEVQFYATDNAGNTGSTVNRKFSIDWQPPTVTINSPAASAWKNADFVIDVTNTDPGTGSGLNTCEWRVESNSVETLAWTAYPCATDQTATVGATKYCDVEGADKCEAFFRTTDVAGNVGTTVSRKFSIDWTPPTVLTGVFSESSDYLWVSPAPADKRLYFGLGMGASAQTFTVSGTANDALSGMDYAAFSTQFGDSPANDPTAANWSADYDIDSSNVAAESITITVYDHAGNSANLVLNTVRNNNLSVTYLALSPTGPPAYLQFRVYYPDGVTEMTTGSPDGLYKSVTGGVDISKFVKIYNKDGVAQIVYDDPADAIDGDFVVQTLAYQTGCGTAGGDAWCLETYTVGCASSLETPHYLSVTSATEIRTNAFYSAILPEEETIDGDLNGGVPTPGPLPYDIGDPGTVEIGAGPDYMSVSAMDDALITADSTVPGWCSGAACNPVCKAADLTDRYCSMAPGITEKPDFVKRDTGAGPVAMTNTIADDPDGPTPSPAAGHWAWDSDDKRIVLLDNPTAPTATMTATLFDQSEKVCVELVNSCGYVTDEGSWSNVEIRLTLSQAPNSGKDISRNDADATHGFTDLTEPATSIADPDQLQIRGKLKKGIACITLTAETIPNDDPASPIKITPEYFGSTPLSHESGEDKPAYVLIRPSTGIPPLATSPIIIDVEDSFIPTPTTTAQAIVLGPHWSHNGGKLAFISRQTTPCSGNPVTKADTGDTPYDNFNIYTMDMTTTLSDCVRLTRNATDMVNDYGVAPHSELAWSPSNDKLVFAAADMLGTGATKLFWVAAATGAVGAATGTQFNYPPAGPVETSEFVWDDITVGTATINVNLNVATPIAVGDTVIVYEIDPVTFAISKREVKTITSVTHDVGVTILGVDPVMTQAFTGMVSGGWSFVELPVTLRQLGQNLVPLGDGAEWFDPDWAGDYAACDANYKKKLLAVRAPSDPTEDTVCSPACVQSGSASVNANIVMMDDTNASGMISIGNGDNLVKITSFTGNAVWPLKPKWSPDCKMIAFLAWDRTPYNDAPTPPSKLSVYIINLEAVYAGFATAAIPVDSLADTGVYKVYDYNTYNMPAYFPNWSADGKLVSFSIDKLNMLDITTVNSGMDDLVSELFGGTDHDSYLEYIMDQPASLGAVFSPQLMGQVSYNEMALTQCPSYAGSSCPNKPNTPYIQVSQMAAGAGAYLRMLTLGDSSEVDSGGGLLFQDGIVTAVFPPGVVASDTVFYNTWPTPYCSGGAESEIDGGGGAGSHNLGVNCAEDPTNEEFIVSGGEAREYFPDGTNFSSYVRLIFHYCDSDNNDKVDAQTEGRNVIYFNSLNNKCYTDAAKTVQTGGGTIDVDTLAVYYWDATVPGDEKWVRMDGVVDKTAKTITVFASHFSRYDTLGFQMGFGPEQLTPLTLTDVHTYPNPYVAARNPQITFAATEMTGGEDVYIEIRIYDIRGSLVTTLARNVTTPYAQDYNAYTLYEWIRPANASGRPLASGVYIYYMIARTAANYAATAKGKFSVVR